MNLNDPPKYRKNFNPLFEPFNCNDKPEAHKISIYS